MRKASIKDINNVSLLIATAKEKPCGKALSELLTAVLPEDYENIQVETDRSFFDKAAVRNETLVLHDTDKDSWENIDALTGIFRRDVVYAIINELKRNTEEIEGL